MKFPPVKIESFRKFCRNTLRGFCVVSVPAYGLRLYEVSVYAQNNSRWAMPPAKAQLDYTGRNLNRGANGPPMFGPALAFLDANTRRAFSDSVVAALLARDPAAFNCGEEDDEEEAA